MFRRLYKKLPACLSFSLKFLFFICSALHFSYSGNVVFCVLGIEIYFILFFAEIQYFLHHRLSCQIPFQILSLCLMKGLSTKVCQS